MSQRRAEFRGKSAELCYEYTECVEGGEMWDILLGTPSGVCSESGKRQSHRCSLETQLQLSFEGSHREGSTAEWKEYGPASRTELRLDLNASSLLAP